MLAVNLGLGIIKKEKVHGVMHFYLSFLECEKIKLVGTSRCSGRVEVYHRDSWGTVCDDNWNMASAEVTCRELQCGTVLEAKKSAFFGEGKEDIWLDDVVCTGSESSILNCQHRPIGENNCGHNEDAGVVCSGKTYLSYVCSTTELFKFESLLCYNLNSYNQAS